MEKFKKESLGPKVSILIPSFNHSLYIEEAIRSVWEQDYVDMELVVVDDGSTDDSKNILARLIALSPIPMKVIVQQNAGICRALNRALYESSGEIIGLLASDDIMAPKRLMEEVGYFDEERFLKVIFSSGQYQRNGKRFGNLHKNIKYILNRGISATRNHILSAAPALYSQARLIRRSFLLELGGFDEDTGSDDWSLHIRIFLALKTESELLFLDRFAFYYRLHGKQLHNRKPFMNTMTRKVIRKYFSTGNRSKAIAEEYLRRSLLFFFKKNYFIGYRYIRLAIRISFVNGVPWRCLLKLLIKMPAFLLRLTLTNR